MQSANRHITGQEKMKDKNNKSSPNTSRKERKSIKSKIIWLLKFCVSALIVTYILTKIFKSSNLPEIAQLLSKLSITSFAVWIAGGFLVKSTGMFMAVWRWKILLEGQGIRIGWHHLIGSFLIGRFIGSFTPSTTGLDGWRLYDIAKHTRNTPASISVILVEKIIGFFVLAVLILVTFPFGKTLLTSSEQMRIFEKASVVIMLLMGIPTAIAFAMILKPSLIRLMVEKLSMVAGRFKDKILKFAEALSIYENKKGLLLRALACGFGVHIGTCSMYYFTGHSLGFGVSYASVLFIGPLMIAATVIPISIAGVGVRELVWAVLIGHKLGGGDVGFASGAIMAFVGYLIGETISLFGGPIWLMRKSSYRMIKQLNSEEKAEGEDNKKGSEANSGVKIMNQQAG